MVIVRYADDFVMGFQHQDEAELQEIKTELRKRLHQTVNATGAWLRSVVRGWLNYFAVPGTSQVLNRFVTEVDHLWAKSLRRRSQRGQRAWPWTRLTRIIIKFVSTSRADRLRHSTLFTPATSPGREQSFRVTE
ncbi:MAG: group II intron maturase-specific domain-containing protein [Planctomycetaceae bacterium]